MALCKFSLPSGEKCKEPAVTDDGFCKWHGPVPPSGDGIKEELEKIAKAGGSLAGFNLKGLDLYDIYLIQADLRGADLRHANLTHAHMYGADLGGADLFKANLEKANFKAVNLKKANLLAVNFDLTKIEGATWDDDYIIQNEKDALDAWKKGDKQRAYKKYKEAEEIYRSIKLAHDQLGHSKNQSPFFLREMVVHRKQMPLFSIPRLASKIMDLATGYGEKPVNVLWTSLYTVFVSAFLYGLFGVYEHGRIVSFWNHEGSLIETIGNLIYFSSVVFTTIGFGDLVPFGASKWVTTIEGFLGQILIAFLIVCIYKKLMER